MTETKNLKLKTYETTTDGQELVARYIDNTSDNFQKIDEFCKTDTTLSVEGGIADAKTVGDNVSQLKEELTHYMKAHPILSIDESLFEHGGINGSGANSAWYKESRIRTKNILYCENDITVGSNGGQYIAVYYNADGSFRSITEWLEKAVTFKKGTFFRLLASQNPNINVEKEVHEIYQSLYFITGKNFDAMDYLLSANRHFDTTVVGSWDKPSFTGLPTFAHLTDIHEDSLRFNTFRQFCRNGIITKGIVTGDIVNDASVPTAFDYIGNTASNTEFLYVVGNHDREYVTRDYVKSKLMPTRTNTYYFNDFDEIRIIVLDQYDQSPSGTSGSSGQYTQEQIDFFIAMLKDSIVDNKHVIVCMHTPEQVPVRNELGFYQRHYQWTQGYNEYVSVALGTPIEDIVDAFKHGKSINKSYRNVSVNTTFSKAGSFVAYMCGHYHADLIGYSQKYEDQIYLMGNQGRLNNSPPSDLARYEGHKSEDCFNVYVIDTKSRLIKIVRFGADMNDILEDRKTLVLEY